MERGQGDSWRQQCLASWMPYAPQGVKGFHDDDDDDDDDDDKSNIKEVQ